MIANWFKDESTKTWKFRIETGVGKSIVLTEQEVDLLRVAIGTERGGIK